MIKKGRGRDTTRERDEITERKEDYRDKRLTDQELAEEKKKKKKEIQKRRTSGGGR